ncbi:hypothetical protein [Adhaeretor mobilis]|uniref:Carboxypeptidase regulatory-like domain-containing protein n=1 Tax=Adhaeretor mobilis TaxID=1930276 RepID=A0A517N0Z2_9BACT|nr:hypothetical protein [Adhaeretor mobilis]QDT00809.1 hypothetical protein HG15A2_41510 [Adhaeretor mobilis]
MSLRTLLFCALGCVAPLGGCADENAVGRFAVSGTVAYDGQQITNGTIDLIPANGFDGKSAGAKIIDGRYEIPQLEGPEQGPYLVMIVANRPSGKRVPADEGSSELVDVPEQYIPSIYNDRTTLKAEISGDRDDLNFDLEKPKQTRRRR